MPEKLSPRMFYVASSRDRLEDVIRVSAALERSGMTNAFSWPDHFSHKCSVSQCGIADRTALAHRELAAAAACSLFVGIHRMGKGAHVELGAALLGSSLRLPMGAPAGRVILVGVDCTDLVFYETRRVEHVADIAGLFSLLGLFAEA